MTTLQEQILQFWFGELSGPHDMGPNGKMWWTKDPELDTQIKQRFGEHLERAAAGDYDGWLERPREAVALVILLDQFSRNIYRGSPKTWENDDKAVACTLDAIERGHPDELRAVERMFLYMPLLHSEELAHHERVLKLVDETLASVPEDARAPFEGWRKSAHQHADIVRRFGRYPHRNAILGRESTPEELAFLEEPGSSF